jgi:hypothetical protein
MNVNIILRWKPELYRTDSARTTLASMVAIAATILQAYG